MQLHITRLFLHSSLGLSQDYRADILEQQPLLTKLQIDLHRCMDRTVVF